MQCTKFFDVAPGNYLCKNFFYIQNFLFKSRVFIPFGMLSPKNTFFFWAISVSLLKLSQRFIFLSSFREYFPFL